MRYIPDEPSAALNQFTKTIQLKRERYALEHGLRIADIDATETIDRAANMLFLRIVNDVYCAKSSKSMSITVPDTWLDSFKLRWFPKWILSRFPVKYRAITETVEASALFPELVGDGENRVIFCYPGGGK
jgi:hypothetical protein